MFKWLFICSLEDKGKANTHLHVSMTCAVNANASPMAVLPDVPIIIKVPRCTQEQGGGNFCSGPDTTLGLGLGTCRQTSGGVTRGGCLGVTVPLVPSLLFQRPRGHPSSGALTLHWAELYHVLHCPALTKQGLQSIRGLKGHDEVISCPGAGKK